MEESTAADSDERIVITGMAGLYPQSRHVKDFSDILYEKVFLHFICKHLVPLNSDLNVVFVLTLREARAWQYYLLFELNMHLYNVSTFSQLWTNARLS